MLVAGGTKYYSDKVTVQAAGTTLTSGSYSPLSIDKLEAIKAVPGVQEVSAGISTL